MSGSIIDTRYLELGEPDFLGKPTRAETASRDGKGTFRQYEHGAIYLAPDAERAYEVHGEIFKKWGELDFESGVLGYPITDQRRMSDGAGRYSEFDNGIIYWSPGTGAHSVRGSILSKYRVFGGPQGVLGYPTTDQTSDGEARFNDFERGGIYRRTGARPFVVHGEIHKKWMDQGGFKGTLGFPISDELPSPNLNTRFNKFENGSLTRIVSVATQLEIPETIPDVEETHDRDVDLLKGDDKKHRANGFRILSVSLYGNPAKPLSTCVWVKDGGPEQKVLFNVSSQKLQSFLADPLNESFQPTIISATGPADKAVFALVCEKRKGPAPVLRSQLVAGPVKEIFSPETFAFWCRWARANNHILRCASIYGDSDSPRYAGIWELNRKETSWNVAYHDANKEIATNFLAESHERFEQSQMKAISKAQQFWARPAFITRSSHGHELRVFRADGVDKWATRTNLTSDNYETELAAFKKENFIPLCVNGALVKGKSTFDAIFAKRIQPQPRRFTITGKHHQSLTAFDDAMEDMVRSTGARAASLAIAKNGKLVYARAFTWAEAGVPAIKPTNLFRIASCSKPITAVGIYQMDEDHILKPRPNSGDRLGNTLVSNVNLIVPSSVGIARRFNTITLKQLLAHKANLRKAVAPDDEVLATFNNALPDDAPAKHNVPINVLQVASHMATVPLEFNDGEFHYSNVGFLFLGFLIEQKLGKRYDQALKERIFSKVGVTRARITSSSPELQEGEVIAFDRELRVGKSVMTKEQPIVPFEYGTTNRLSRPGSGGWMMAPADYVRFLSVLHSGDGTLLKPETVATAERIDQHGGGISGGVAHVEHMTNGFTFAVFFAINFLGDFESRIRDIINVLPSTAWPLDDQFETILK